MTYKGLIRRSRARDDGASARYYMQVARILSGLKKNVDGCFPVPLLIICIIFILSGQQS